MTTNEQQDMLYPGKERELAKEHRQMVLEELRLLRREMSTLKETMLREYESVRAEVIAQMNSSIIPLDGRIRQLETKIETYLIVDQEREKEKKRLQDRMTISISIVSVLTSILVAIGSFLGWFSNMFHGKTIH